jgi:hypothetical protein
MARGRVLLTAVLTTLLAVSVAPEARGAAGDPFQPDGWIKLCGQSLGCKIDPLPHPWLGKDIYNTTGRKQTVSVKIDNGEGVRFWITVQNDGTQSDTVAVVGCAGNRNFEVNRVLLGKHKDQDAGATDLTKKYKQGTLTFDLNAGAAVVFTLNIITHYGVGKTYACVNALHSANATGAQDVVVAKMTIF